MRKLSTTESQRRTLHYLKSVHGKARLRDLPMAACHGPTLSVLEDRGLVNVSVKLTQKGFAVLGDMKP